VRQCDTYCLGRAGAETGAAADSGLSSFVSMFFSFFVLTSFFR
jgi:hypothetical protein